MFAPRRLFRTLAFAEAVTWTLLIIGMLIAYVFDGGRLGIRVGGGVHGFVFLLYCVVTVLVGVDARWGAPRIVLGLVSAVIPYATVPFERAMERRGGLQEQWRLRLPADASVPADGGVSAHGGSPADDAAPEGGTSSRGGATPDGFAEQVAALCIRRPLPAAMIAAVATVVVFLLLLQAGPPTQWFS